MPHQFLSDERWRRLPAWCTALAIGALMSLPLQTARAAAAAVAPARLAPPTSLTPESFEALSGLHFGFRAADVPEAELASLPPSFPDGQPGDMIMDEGTGGYRDEIGIVTKSAARWAITFDARAEANMIANARSSKWFPIHVEDPVHGGPVRFDLNPYKSKASSIKGDYAVKPDLVGNKAIHVDPAHEPHMLYFYALLMRARRADPKADAEFRWALQEMKYWCAYNYLAMTDNGRGFAKGILNPLASQPRASAWGLAALFQLFHVLPKDDPWYPSVKYSVEQNILFLDGNFRLGTYDNSAFKPYYDRPTGSVRNTLGLVQAPDSAYADGKRLMIGAFQAGFQADVILFGQRLDLDLDPPVKAAFRDLALFVARWPVLLFGAANTRGSYDWRRAGEYAMAVGTLTPAGPVYFDNGGQVLAANDGHLPPLPDDHAFRNHGGNQPAEGIATGFVEDILPALAMAVDLEAEGAEVAYARAASATQWPGGTSYQFSVLPRGRWFREAVEAPSIRKRDRTPAP